MSKKTPRYITTTLPYVNGDPHIGFALEILHADVLARAWRAQGHKVFFTMGTDEHGQKIYEAAEKQGIPVQQYVDGYAAEFQKLKSALNLSNNAFVRTTDPVHYEAAQEMWRRCEAAGDIYKKTYTGWYCVGCEAYKTEHEIETGSEGWKCVLHPNLTLQQLSENNYFFRLSRYADRLIEYLNQSGVVVPEWRREEALNFVKDDLQDFSISRDISRLTWGVPVPGDDEQVMYVWFDALTNYISVLGWPSDPDGDFETFWEEGRTLQVAGKDQVRFQSVMWQAMLMSAEIKLTDQVFYHGFINSGGQKMSKSLGNVISPYDLIAKYGLDATRYLLLRHVQPADDSDVTWQRLDEWYTANLVNGLGNLVARVQKLAETHLNKPVKLSREDTEVDTAFYELIDSFRFNEAMDHVFQIVAEADALMTEREPFKKVKDDDEAIQEEGAEDIEELVRSLASVASHLAVLLPDTSATILESIQENERPENLFPRLPA
jgi:methionyl-tRNA synthetase